MSSGVGNGLIGEIGLTKSAAADVRYADIRAGNYKAFYCGNNPTGLSAKYIFYPGEKNPIDTYPQLKSLLDEHDQTMLLNKLTELRDKMHALYHDRRKRILNSPYTSYAAWFGTVFFGSYISCITTLVNNAITCLPGILLFLVTAHLTMVTVMLGCVIGVLMDVFTCRLSCCRYGAVEKAWIDKFLADFPHLDQNVMDSEVAQEMLLKVDYLGSRYQGRATVSYEQRIDTVVTSDGDGGSKTEYYTRYVLKIWDARYVPVPPPSHRPILVEPPGAIHQPGVYPNSSVVPVGDTYSTGQLTSSGMLAMPTATSAHTGHESDVEMAAKPKYVSM